MVKGFNKQKFKQKTIVFALSRVLKPSEMFYEEKIVPIF